MSFLNDVLNIFIKYYPQLLTGVGNTLLIALTSTVAGLALGLLTGVVRTAPMSKNPVLRALHKLLNAIIAIYVEIFRVCASTRRSQISRPSPNEPDWQEIP